MRIGFIGLGAMGGPMATRLAKDGMDIAVFDLSKQAVEKLVKAGAKALNSPLEIAAYANIICISVPNSAILTSIIAAPTSGVLNGIKKDTLIIDLSSVEPSTSQKLAQQVQAKGAFLIDAPVSGGVSGAENGTLTIMVGASNAEYEKALPVLNVLGKPKHLGPVGSGGAMKLVNNLLLASNMAAVAESLVLGVKLGLNPQTMLDTIKNSSGRSYALEAKCENFIFKGDFKPGFSVDLQYKDLELAVQTAKSLSQPLPMGNCAQQLFEVAKARGQGGEDISSLIKYFEEFAGVKVRN